MKKYLKQLLVVLCMFAASLGVSAQSLVFHLAGGEETTVTLPATFTVMPAGDKVVIVIEGSDNVELPKDEIMCVTYRNAKGDVNGDMRVDVADVSTLVGIVVGAIGGAPVSNDDDTPLSATVPKDVIAVDLGLPSGTKWANMNLGATAQNEYGLFFAWGETVGYSSNDATDGRKFNWGSYKWMNVGKSSGSQINKYQIDDGVTSACWYSNGTFVGDGQTELLPEDDAATANWGSGWRMPTIEQYRELINSEYTTTEWTAMNGVDGCKITSKSNGKSIFLPAAGYRYGTILSAGSCGYYWSRSLCTDYSDYARYLYFSSGYVITGCDNGYGRRSGQSIRPVRVQN